MCDGILNHPPPFAKKIKQNKQATMPSLLYQQKNKNKNKARQTTTPPPLPKKKQKQDTQTTIPSLLKPYSDYEIDADCVLKLSRAYTNYQVDPIVH
jgi:hypothetical protein